MSTIKDFKEGMLVRVKSAEEIKKFIADRGASHPGFYSEGEMARCCGEEFYVTRTEGIFVYVEGWWWHHEWLVNVEKERIVAELDEMLAHFLSLRVPYICKGRKVKTGKFGKLPTCKVCK